MLKTWITLEDDNIYAKKNSLPHINDFFHNLCVTCVAERLKTRVLHAYRRGVPSLEVRCVASWAGPAAVGARDDVNLVRVTPRVQTSGVWTVEQKQEARCYRRTPLCPAVMSSSELGNRFPSSLIHSTQRPFFKFTSASLPNASD